MNILLKGAFLPSVTKIIHSRINRLEKLILSMKGFKSKYHFGTIVFQHLNNPEYVLFEWPEPLCRLNEMFASDSLTEDTISDLCNYLDKNITNSLDIEKIVQDFQLDQISAEDIVKHAVKFQFNIERKNVHEIKMPSKFTQIRIAPQHPYPCDALLRLKDFFCEELCKLNDSFFLPTSLWTVDDFLHMLEEHPGFELIVGLDFFSVKFADNPPVRIVKDEKLRDLIAKYPRDSTLCHIYHRVLAEPLYCGIDVSFKRLYLKECLTEEYSPLILLANRSKVKVEFIGSNYESVIDRIIKKNFDVPVIPTAIQGDHLEVSLEESIWLLDPRKKMVKRNITPTYVNINQIRKLKFNVVQDPNLELAFKDIKTGKFYNIILDHYDHYLERSSMPNLCFAQFAMYYRIEKNVTDDEDDEELDDEMNETDVEIKTACNVDRPQYMLRKLRVRGNKTLLLRKNASILKYPVYTFLSNEYIHQQVMLYHPHSSHDVLNLSIQELKTLYFDRLRGQSSTKIDTLRLKLFPGSCKRSWELLFE